MATKHTSTDATATATAAYATRANGARCLLCVQPLDGDIYVRTDGKPATAGAGSFHVREGRELYFGKGDAPSDAVSIIRAGSSDVAVTVVEG